MILRGARVALNATETERLDLRVGPASGLSIDLDGFLILPGLINAHDHLEFNLFPRLGRGPYPNAAAWAQDIYHPEESPIRDQLRIPKPLRLWWGGIKNLIAGVTTVLHHNPYEPVFRQNFPVRVVERFGWAHSLHFGGDVASAWDETPRGAPFLVHACEGTDHTSAAEVHRLDATGVLGPDTVLVHGVALDCEGLELVQRRGASIIWCPSSNHFTLGRSLAPEVLQSGIPIALGSDSALTGAGDLIDEIELAEREVGRARAFQMVTDVAAKILRLDSGEGAIRAGGIADLVVVRDWDRIRPELVLIGGEIKLVSTNLVERFASILPPRLHPIEVRGRGRWLTPCNIPALVQAVMPVLGEHFHLAGREVAA